MFKPARSAQTRLRYPKIRQAGMILFITTLVLIVPNLTRFVN